MIPRRVRMATKTMLECFVCNQMLPFEAFPRHDRHALMKHTQCRKCRNVKDRTAPGCKVYNRRKGFIAVKELKDSYIRRLLKTQGAEKAPPELIEVKRALIKLKRVLLEISS